MLTLPFGQSKGTMTQNDKRPAPELDESSQITCRLIPSEAPDAENRLVRAIQILLDAAMEPALKKPVPAVEAKIAQNEPRGLSRRE